MCAKHLFKHIEAMGGGTWEDDIVEAVLPAVLVDSCGQGGVANGRRAKGDAGDGWGWKAFLLRLLQDS